MTCVSVSARIVAIPISGREVALCSQNGKSAEIGGTSNVRDNVSGERMRSLSEDQLVGQICTLAGTKWLFGSLGGHLQYKLGRIAADRAPTVGDGGADVLGSNIDFKGSLVRYPKMPLEEYSLLVRPKERHPSNVYVCVLLTPHALGDDPWASATAHLMGWESDAHLPAFPESNGQFEGAFRIVARDLNPCPPFAYSI